ncbi:MULTISPECIES: C40 family peptidase [unclassified Streptomyces]|uniref:C40 family peptidase n=1 Tax=unclassified Streptomyces TaxID=2593676 RepID=UPI0006AE361D|nr:MULTISPECIES: C40 family peptidase [unclassified Streptomyces]KOX21058.1 glycoside hydrolase [Streptomyces sp. NRRL F-6491]KOX41056.1 glycoside hydrolase [Streptomyces sp. NRRL F-6492]
MSHTAHIPSHRKPRRSASKLALRAGVAGGVLGTIAVAGAAGPANAEPVTETIEMPTLGSLAAGTNLASAVAASAEASQQEALDQSLQSLEQTALQKASQEARKAKAEAERKAAAERAEKARLKAEAERQAAEEAAERASRSETRTQLATNSSSSSNDGGSSSSSSDNGSSASDSGSRTQAPTGSAASIVAFARAQVGDAYISGGTGPNAWDCSGLVQAAYRAAGIDLPRISHQQSSMGSSVSLGDLQPGDILYWGSRSGSYHVAIYVGGGKYVGAQNSSTGVVERSLDWDPPSGAVRIL